MKELMSRLNKQDNQLNLVIGVTVVTYGLYMVFMIGHAFATPALIQSVLMK